jgi:hypothetical protein
MTRYCENCNDKLDKGEMIYQSGDMMICEYCYNEVKYEEEAQLEKDIKNGLYGDNN